MNKKLMLPAAGVLAALVFAALPAVASAGEFTADCETNASCAGSLAGVNAQLRNDAGEGISCPTVDGKATVTNGSPTGFLELTFTNCVETITGFKFKCTNTATSGKIETGPMVTHLIYLEETKTTPGFKVTLPGHGTEAGGVTFNCAGFAKKLVTGAVVGDISNPECDTFQASHTAVFGESSAGVQRWMQATTTGSNTDLISNNDPGVYTTSAQIGSGFITWPGNNKVKLTC
jgi:hypothetical protein